LQHSALLGFRGVRGDFGVDVKALGIVIEPGWAGKLIILKFVSPADQFGDGVVDGAEGFGTGIGRVIGDGEAVCVAAVGGGFNGGYDEFGGGLGGGG